MNFLYKAANIFNKIAQDIQVATKKPIQNTKKPIQKIKENIEYRDRFHGAEGEERQRLIQEEAKKKGFTLVPDKITPTNETEVISTVKTIVAKKYPEMDEGLRNEFVYTIVPQIKLETGYRPHNYNMGNLHAYTGGQNQYWKGLVAAWNDPQVDKSGHQYIQKDWFLRAYDSLENGIGDWFNLLEKHFTTAFEAAKRGDVEIFAKELRAKGYYTASLESYTKGLRLLKDKMKKKYTN